MIKRFEEKDISSIMQIWLESNLDAHSFIAESYWKNKYEAVEKMILDAEIYVYEDCDGINGFVGLIGNYIAGIFVRKEKRSEGIGKQLIDMLKCQYSDLTLDVFVKNIRAVDFYTREGFCIQNKHIDYDTQEEEYTMCCKAVID